jgi:adenosylcobinamide kinase/adenosylcobinamide-phosphate guanylyltransferase
VSRPLVFILGGTRSGKSTYAAARASALATDGRVTYLGTALPGDPELDDRVAAHRRARPAAWETVDVGLDLAGAVRSVPDDRVVLLDGLTLWLSALTADGSREPGSREPEPLDPGRLLAGPIGDALAALADRPGPAVVVSDEISLGVVPLGAETRRFVDLLGLVHQRVAAMADEAYLMVAGLPMPLPKR